MLVTPVLLVSLLVTSDVEDPEGVPEVVVVFTSDDDPVEEDVALDFDDMLVISVLAELLVVIEALPELLVVMGVLLLVGPTVTVLLLGMLYGAVDLLLVLPPVEPEPEPEPELELPDPELELLNPELELSDSEVEAPVPVVT